MNSGRQKGRMERIVLLVLAFALVMWNLGPEFNKILAISSTAAACVVDPSNFDEQLNVQSHPTYLSWMTYYQTINANETYVEDSAYYTLYEEDDKIIDSGKVEVLGSSGKLQMSGNTSYDGVTLSPFTNYKLEITLKTRYRYQELCTKSSMYKVRTTKDGPSINEHHIEMYDFETEETSNGGYHKRSSMIDGFMIGDGNFNHIGDEGEYNDLTGFDFIIADLENDAYSLMLSGSKLDDNGPWKHMQITSNNDNPDNFTFQLDNFSVVQPFLKPIIIGEEGVETLKEEELSGEVEDVRSYQEVKRDVNQLQVLKPNTRYTSVINFRNDLEEVESGRNFYDFTTRPDVTEWMLTPGHIDTAMPDSSNATGGSTYGCFYPYTMDENGDCQSIRDSNALPARIGAEITGMQISIYSDESLSDTSLISSEALELIGDDEELYAGQFNNLGFEYDFRDLVPDTTYYVTFVVSNDGGETEIYAGEFTTFLLLNISFVDAKWDIGNLTFEPKHKSLAVLRGEDVDIPVERISGYETKYYKINDSERQVINDGNINFTLEEPFSNLYIQYLSTVINVEVPVKVEFKGSLFEPIESNIKSGLYQFRNNSELPVNINFRRMDIIDSDEIDIVSSIDKVKDQLKLQLIYNDDNEHGNEEHDKIFPAIKPSYNYEKNENFNCILGGSTDNELSSIGLFKIGGSYSGRFYVSNKKPVVNLIFHIGLMYNGGVEE